MNNGGKMNTYASQQAEKKQLEAELTELREENDELKLLLLRAHDRLINELSAVIGQHAIRIERLETKQRAEGIGALQTN
jgi:transposase-like protein